ncbi:hypothetical protein BU25DRAFT_413448 [Macroventuria anomochaeta]|uniref:Uncharacterized protein n=1 Tax=Macroventuria anomochaeta TaxID=301207 RepID=A0ACB6RRG6_9PLEO|nr:uncharacterized protein BU25DRAFT_413448 [Macroventuria anomochaeta]KAF2624555.1 hypothetical protein BU25DRAFT_413448 [Macroventuria anomochaeta]
MPRNGEKVSTRKKANTDSKKVSNQRRVSENLRVTKHLNQSVTNKLDGSTEEPLPTPASAMVSAATAPASERRRTEHQERVSHNITVESSAALPVQTSHAHSADDDDDDDDFGQLCFDFEPSSRTANDSMCSAYTSELTEHAEMQFDDDDFDDDLMDDDLLDLTTDTIDVSSSPKLQSSSPIKIHIADESVQQTQMPGTSADTAVVLDEKVNSSGPMSKKFVSPVTLTTRLLAATGYEARKPIVRPAFPAAVRDRSPIIGLSPNTLLRTCFRVGEAINQSCQATKTGNHILIELYARVLNSDRDDIQQRFTFCDLFHAKLPYIQATYAAAIWKTVQLFEYDSARLLSQGRICRCIGTMKRNGKDWVMTVLNIWEATWDDVQWVEGIVSS